jgi:hypothetical protein
MWEIIMKDLVLKCTQTPKYPGTPILVLKCNQTKWQFLFTHISSNYPQSV